MDTAAKTVTGDHASTPLPSALAPQTLASTGAPELGGNLFAEPAMRLRDGSSILDSRGAPITPARFADALLELAREVNPTVEALVSRSQHVTERFDASTAHRDTENLRGLGSDRAECSRKLLELEEAAIKRVVELSDNPGSDVRVQAVRVFAAQSAEAELRLRSLRQEIEHGFEYSSGTVNMNGAVIQNAWARNPDNFRDAVLEACRQKKNLLGQVQLVVWNDIDQNLTFDHSHNEFCPGVPFAKLAYEKHGRAMLENTVFPALYGHMIDRDAQDGAWGRHLYRQVGASIFQQQENGRGVLPGVREAFAESREYGVDMRILTRNLRLVGDGVGEMLKIDHDRIYGRTCVDHSSTLKDLMVMRNLLRNPYTVHVIVDDEDPSLINGITNGSYCDGSKVHQHAFIMCRANVGDRKYQLGEVLDQLKIPHGSHGDEYTSLLPIIRAYGRERLSPVSGPLDRNGYLAHPHDGEYRPGMLP